MVDTPPGANLSMNPSFKSTVPGPLPLVKNQGAQGTCKDKIGSKHANSGGGSSRVSVTVLSALVTTKLNPTKTQAIEQKLDNLFE